jgi:hypothetical protein
MVRLVIAATAPSLVDVEVLAGLGRLACSFGLCNQHQTLQVTENVT